jgi:hypothetical protein
VYAEETGWSIVPKDTELLGMLDSAISQADPAGVRAAVMTGPWGGETCKAAWLDTVENV